VRVEVMCGCNCHAIEGRPIVSSSSRWQAQPQAAGYGWRCLDSVDNGGRGLRDIMQVADSGGAVANLSRRRPSILPLPHHRSRPPALPAWLARAGSHGQIWWRAAPATAWRGGRDGVSAAARQAAHTRGVDRPVCLMMRRPSRPWPEQLRRVRLERGSTLQDGGETRAAGSSGLMARSGDVSGGCRLKDKDRWASTSGGASAMVLERRGGQQLCNPGARARPVTRGAWWAWWHREAWCGVTDLIRLLGFSSDGQGGRELRCIGRNPAPALSVPPPT
jgi:hypothetical protein